MESSGGPPQRNRSLDAAPLSIAEAVQAPLTRLFEEYSAAIETMRKALEALAPFARGWSAPMLPTSQPRATALETVSVDVPQSDRQALIDFEDALGQISGVQRVALKELQAGHASFEVTLDTRTEGAEDTGPGFSVVCAWCGRLLTLGGVRVSHGLCPECASQASNGHAIHETAPEQWETKPRDDALVYLKRGKQTWMERRPNGKGGWSEVRTEYPAETAAHVVLEHVSAKYPDLLVVVSGDGGATLASGVVRTATG